MAITDETIEYVAALAKLELTDEEKERAKKDLGNIIGYVDTMPDLTATLIQQVSSRCLMYLPIIMFSGRTL